MRTLRLHQLPAQNGNRLPVTIVCRDDDGMETHVDGLSAARLDDETRRELRWYFEDFLDHLYDPPSRQRAARLEDRMTELGEALFRDLFEMTRDASTLWATLQSHIRATRI